MSFVGQNIHDDVIKWKHFPRHWSFVRRIHQSPVNSPHKGQWRGALMFPLICAWINAWVNNRETGDLRRHRAHYDVIVMTLTWRHWPKSCLPPLNCLSYSIILNHDISRVKYNISNLNISISRIISYQFTFYQIIYRIVHRGTEPRLIKFGNNALFYTECTSWATHKSVLIFRTNQLGPHYI